MLFLSMQQFCRPGANRFFDTWYSTWLQDGRGLTVGEANLLTGLPLVMVVVGGVVGGWLSDLVFEAYRQPSRTGGRAWPS